MKRSTSEVQFAVGFYLADLCMVQADVTFRAVRRLNTEILGGNYQIKQVSQELRLFPSSWIGKPGLKGKNKKGA